MLRRRGKTMKGWRMWRIKRKTQLEKRRTEAGVNRGRRRWRREREDVGEEGGGGRDEWTERGGEDGKRMMARAALETDMRAQGHNYGEQTQCRDLHDELHQRGLKCLEWPKHHVNTFKLLNWQSAANLLKVFFFAVRDSVNNWHIAPGGVFVRY